MEIIYSWLFQNRIIWFSLKWQKINNFRSPFWIYLNINVFLTRCGVISSSKHLITCKHYNTTVIKRLKSKSPLRSVSTLSVLGLFCKRVPLHCYIIITKFQGYGILFRYFQKFDENFWVCWWKMFCVFTSSVNERI